MGHGDCAFGELCNPYFPSARQHLRALSQKRSQERERERVCNTIQYYTTTQTTQRERERERERTNNQGADSFIFFTFLLFFLFSMKGLIRPSPTAPTRSSMMWCTWLEERNKKRGKRRPWESDTICVRPMLTHRRGKMKRRRRTRG